jgi:hypothetical protein
MPMKMASGGGDNASDKYLRNKIRHDLFLYLKRLLKFIASFQKTQSFCRTANGRGRFDYGVSTSSKEKKMIIRFDLNQ